MSLLLNVEKALQDFKNKVLNWVAAEEVVIESIAIEMVQATQTIFLALKPQAVADVKAILQELPADFLKADFASIVEEVKIKAEDDLKTLLNTAKPQILEALVGILIHSL